MDQDTGTISHGELLVSRALTIWPPGDIVTALGQVVSEFYRLPPPPLEEIAEESAEIHTRRVYLLNQFKVKVRESPNVTGGAKELVEHTSELLSAYRVVLSDKLARSVLREDSGIGVVRAAEAAGSTIEPEPETPAAPAAPLPSEPPAGAPEDQGSEFTGDPKRTSDPSAAIYVQEGITPGVGERPPFLEVFEDDSEAPNWSQVPIPELCRDSGVDFAAPLESSRAIEFQFYGATHAILVSEIPEALEDESRSEEMLAVFKGLLSVADRFTLLTIYAAVMAGKLGIVPDLLSHLRVFATRALMGANAYESAYQEARAIAEDADAMASLPAGEQARMDRITARSAARSGRVSEAVDRYTMIFAEDPSDDDVFRELLAVVFTTDEALTSALCDAALHSEMALKTNDWLFIAELLRGMGRVDEAFRICFELTRREEPPKDAFVGLANVGLSLGNDTIWQSAIENYFRAHRLPLKWSDHDQLRPFGFVGDAPEPMPEHPLVSIVMTTFNASDTLELSVKSIRDQSCANWELIIVDDNSSDGTQDIIIGLTVADTRIRNILRNDNSGTYVSKNEGIRMARGEFVTFHDSDDWMHPRRLEGHLSATVGGIRCTTSMWLRMDAMGQAVVRRGGPFTHLNPASTFYRRSVFDSVGYFDSVRTGADAELLARVRARFGPSAVRSISSPLAIGLHHEKSLTQSGATAFDEFRYSPVRLAYTESWLRWHLLQMAQGRELRAEDGNDRPFSVPAAIRP
jgi:hypothetical protein